MSSGLNWDRDGRDWPNRAASRFVAAGGLGWHVQIAGPDAQGAPVLLVLHGTAASSHSWRAMLMPLAAHFTVVAPDLPGHGFTSGRVPGGPGLPQMGRALSALLAELNAPPALIAGHSAGAAIALEVASRMAAPPPVIGFGAALMPFPGLAAQLFPALAKALFVNPLVPRIFARLAAVPGEAERFLARATASQIDAAGLALYARLLARHGHVGGALAMMANWDLSAFAPRLAAMAMPVRLIHGGDDPAVPLASVRAAAARLLQADVVVWDGLGHLAHEEEPERAAAAVVEFAAQHAILQTSPAKRRKRQ